MRRARSREDYASIESTMLVTIYLNLLVFFFFYLLIAILCLIQIFNQKSRISMIFVGERGRYYCRFCKLKFIAIYRE